MKRNARNAIHGDLARILDPSYAPASANLPPTAYVDRHGYLHDPDYRHFPAISPPPSQPSSDDDDTVPVDNDFYAHISNAYDRAGNAYVHPRKRYDQYSYIYASYRSPYHYFTTPTTASSSSPPTSFESDATVFDEADDSAFLDDSHSHVNTLKKKLGKRRSSSSQSSTCSPSRKRRSEDRRSSCSTAAETSPRVSVEESPQRRLSPHNELDEHYSSLHTPPPHHDFDRSHQQSHLESEKHDHQEWTPTCTQNLQRQWQAISLRVRFSVFRAQRRVKRRIQDLI
ncbi:hypothetical protein APHAL10511_008488 [Amanita phalloides]|nr:hypothetical protein APHAL10511_008488 [Amanita phalloides]